MIQVAQAAMAHLRALPFRLEHVRDLRGFEGPLLAEFKNGDGEVYLYKWCDCDDSSNRWMVIRVLRRNLFRYLLGAVTLREVLVGCPDQVAYLVDLDSALSVVDCWLISVSAVPQEYLPSANSAIEVQPQAESGVQDVYVEGDLDIDNIRIVERRYRQAYTFLATYGIGKRGTGFAVRQRLTRGWVFHSVYREMEARIDVADRARATALNVASPGFMRLDVDDRLAAGVRDTLTEYAKRGRVLRRYIGVMHEWVNATKKDVNWDPADPAVLALFVSTAEGLGIDHSRLLESAPDLSAAVRMLVSFHNRVRSVLEEHQSGRAMVVGLDTTVREG